MNKLSYKKNFLWPSASLQRSVPRYLMGREEAWQRNTSVATSENHYLLADKDPRCASYSRFLFRETVKSVCERLWVHQGGRWKRMKRGSAGPLVFTVRAPDVFKIAVRAVSEHHLTIWRKNFVAIGVFRRQGHQTKLRETGYDFDQSTQ
jgi:hypothetical protein